MHPSKFNPNFTGLFKVINGLKMFGVGAKVTRTIYRFPETYWIITKVKLSQKDQTHGKAWGRLVWRGRPKLKDERIGAPLKKQWSLVSLPDHKFKGTPEELLQIIEDSRTAVEIPPTVDSNDATQKV